MTDHPGVEPVASAGAPARVPPRAVAAGAAPGPRAVAHLFTAEELPQPPEWMRSPPAEEAETLFGAVDAEDEAD